MLAHACTLKMYWLVTIKSRHTWATGYKVGKGGPIWWRDPTWHTGGPLHRNYCRNKTDNRQRLRLPSMCYDIEAGK
jgi:hypothetical protein